jgi:hypothetical protein
VNVLVRCEFVSARSRMETRYEPRPSPGSLNSVAPFSFPSPATPVSRFGPR